MANAQGFAHVVVGNQHADAAGGQVANDSLDVDHGDRIDAGERFVQQHEARLDDQRAGDFHPPPLPAGQGRARAAAQVRDVQVVQQPLQAHSTRVRIQVAAGFQDGTQVVLDRQLAKHRRFLRQVAQAQARPLGHARLRDVHAVDGHVAAVGRHQADDHVKAGGLAGAVGAEQADDLARRDLQRHIGYGRTTTVTLAQVVRGQLAHGAAFSAPRWG